MIRTGSITSSGRTVTSPRPSSTGRAVGRTRSTRPVRPELARSGRRGRAEYGSRCPAGRSAGVVRPRDQGRTLPRASIGFLVQSPHGHQNREKSPKRTPLKHVGGLLEHAGCQPPAAWYCAPSWAAAVAAQPLAPLSSLSSGRMAGTLRAGPSAVRPLPMAGLAALCPFRRTWCTGPAVSTPLTGSPTRRSAAPWADVRGTG